MPSATNLQIIRKSRQTLATDGETIRNHEKVFAIF